MQINCFNNASLLLRSAFSSPIPLPLLMQTFNTWAWVTAAACQVGLPQVASPRYLLELSIITGPRSTPLSGFWGPISPAKFLSHQFSASARSPPGTRTRTRTHTHTCAHTCTHTHTVPCHAHYFADAVFILWTILLPPLSQTNSCPAYKTHLEIHFPSWAARLRANSHETGSQPSLPELPHSLALKYFPFHVYCLSRRTLNALRLGNHILLYFPWA